MAGFDYQTNVAAVKNALEDYNTTTSTPSLKTDMSTTVQTIEVNDPDKVGIQLRNLPALYIRIRDASEGAAAFGPTGPGSNKVRKYKEVRYEIFGLYKKEGMRETTEDHLQHIYKLAQNTEAIFQAEYQLSGTALWCHPERTDFGDALIDGDIVKGFRLDLRARYLFR